MFTNHTKMIFEDDIWPLEYLIKILKIEIQAKKRLVSVGTSFYLNSNHSDDIKILQRVITLFWL